MFHKLSRILAATLAILFVAATATLAAEESMSGTIQEVNAKERTLTLRSEDGKTLELQAPAALLTGLQAGDVVEVKASGKQATVINKQRDAQLPGMEGVQPQQPGQSGEMPQSEEPSRTPRSQ